jgi:uncharacterized phage protein (TIGR01671 family)
MEREIKFRGQMTTGEWVFGLPHLDLQGSTAYFNECSYRICWNPETGGQANAPIKNGTLCQFTGLTDKNGKEIYEGDITDEGEVIFHTEYLGFFVKTEWAEQEFKPLYDFAFLEIIGNIYENPELLKDN